MPNDATRPGNRLMDRPEYRLKQKPLTCLEDTTVFDAVLAMSEKNFGAVIVTDNLKKVIGVFTERDVMTKVVAKELSSQKTLVKDIMTPNPQVANEICIKLDHGFKLCSLSLNVLPGMELFHHLGIPAECF